jgi:hypothetical protein
MDLVGHSAMRFEADILRECAGSHKELFGPRNGPPFQKFVRTELVKGGIVSARKAWDGIWGSR